MVIFPDEAYEPDRSIKFGSLYSDPVARFAEEQCKKYDLINPVNQTFELWLTLHSAASRAEFTRLPFSLKQETLDSVDKAAAKLIKLIDANPSLLSAINAGKRRETSEVKMPIASLKDFLVIPPEFLDQFDQHGKDWVSGVRDFHQRIQNLKKKPALKRGGKPGVEKAHAATVELLNFWRRVAGRPVTIDFLSRKEGEGPASETCCFLKECLEFIEPGIGSHLRTALHKINPERQGKNKCKATL